MYRRAFEEAIVFFADEKRIVNSFLTDILHVCVCTDNADVVRIRVKLVEGDVLSDEHSNTNS